MKHEFILLNTIAFIGTANAASVVYNFTGDSLNPNPAGSTGSSKTSNATSNSFGTGITVSTFNLNTEDRESAIVNTHDFVAEGSGGYGMHAYQSFNVGGATMSITITVDSSHSLSLSSLGFLYGVYDDAAGSQSGNTSYTLTSTLGGIASNSTGTLAMNSGSLVSQDYSAALGASLQDLTDTSVTFSWTFTTANGYDSGNANRGHVMDNIVLNGTVSAIPEPSFAALIGLGGLAFVMRRRK